MLFDEKKTLSIILIVLLVVNMILFGLQKISALSFWGLILTVFLIMKFYIKKK